MAEKRSPAWLEGFQPGVADAATGGMTFICGGSPKTLDMAEGYWAGREAGLRQRRGEPEPEPRMAAEAGS